MLEQKDSFLSKWIYHFIFTLPFFSDYSMVLLIKGGELSGANSYQDVVQTAFGIPGYYFLTAVQFIYPFVGKKIIDIKKDRGLKLIGRHRKAIAVSAQYLYLPIAEFCLFSFH